MYSLGDQGRNNVMRDDDENRSIGTRLAWCGKHHILEHPKQALAIGACRVICRGLVVGLSKVWTWVRGLGRLKPGPKGLSSPKRKLSDSEVPESITICGSEAPRCTNVATDEANMFTLNPQLKSHAQHQAATKIQTSYRGHLVVMCLEMDVSCLPAGGESAHGLSLCCVWPVL
ncbi:hypothetical protein KSS87_010716 [Heliosperma pusillum]|nr:hypothetical protein KSS87_010716 [Heliosperma pusillum]